MSSINTFDVIVVGAGHAGCEAAAIAAKIGCKTLLLTGNLDTIAKMSCNPSIGGVAKGNIVREVDALGGQMAMNADATAIQFRMLNASKGTAVQGPRAQCDKQKYSERMKYILENFSPDLNLFQAIVEDLIINDDTVIGVKTNIGINFFSKTVVLTNGTFLRGLMHIGTSKIVGGRLGDFSSQSLSSNLEKYGIKLGRMKTGTPARILGSSIDFSKCEKQIGDLNPCLFGFYESRSDDFKLPVSSCLFNAIMNKQLNLTDLQCACWIDHTNAKTKEIILRNIDKSPLYSKEITGIGPRYCPSIEDKYVRFADKDQHRLFLEPEGNSTDEWYINGLSTSFPFSVQEEIIHSVPSLTHAKIMRPAYAVEYDYAPPTQIYSTLESKIIQNLFCAGQINGTSGYEEAAGQGILAGINAARKSLGLDQISLTRYSSYIGVLVDDLVTKGTFEPYRMFTSRAEYRLLLNHSSADIRLIDIAEKCNLLDETRLSKTKYKLERVEFWTRKLEEVYDTGERLSDLLRKNFGNLSRVSLPSKLINEPKGILDEVIYRVVYAGYMEREYKWIKKTKDMDLVKIPDLFDYEQIKSLKNETRQKLQQFKPLTLGEASRISGISPVDISTIWVHIEKLRKS